MTPEVGTGQLPPPPLSMIAGYHASAKDFQFSISLLVTGEKNVQFLTDVIAKYCNNDSFHYKHIGDLLVGRRINICHSGES